MYAHNMYGNRIPAKQGIPTQVSDIMAGACTKEGGSKLPRQGITPVLQGQLVVVSVCSQCGNPIFGRPTLTPGEVPVIERTCCCSFGGGLQSRVIR